MKSFNISFNGINYPCNYLREKFTTKFLENLVYPDEDSSELYAFDLETYATEDYKEDDDGALLCVKSKIRTLQIFDGESVAILDFKTKDGGNILDNPYYFACLYSWLLALTEHGNLVAHNALFETCQIQYLANKYSIEEHLKLDCTMVAFRLVKNAISDEPSTYKDGLGPVTKLVTGVDLPKDQGTSDWSVYELTDAQIEYCALDAIAPYFVFEKLYENLEELEMLDVYNININAQAPLAQMNMFGITLDKKHHVALAKSWESELIKAEEEVGELLNKHLLEKSHNELLEIFFDKVKLEYLEDAELHKYLYMFDKENLSYMEWMHDMNWLEEVAAGLKGNKEQAPLQRSLRKIYLNMDRYFVKMSSNKQVSDWLRENLDEEDLVDWPLSEKTGHLKLDSDTMGKFEYIPLIEPISRFNTYSKLTSNYGKGLEKFIVKHEDGSFRIHGNFSLAFTGTGRLSSFKPNLQNQPARGEGAEIRECYIARNKNRRLVCADYSQIEVRVAAMLSQDEAMLEAFRNGVDIHSLTGANISGKSVEEVATDKELRQKSKALVFGLQFGAGAKTLREYARKQYKVLMTEEESIAAVEAYRNMYPDFRKWQMRTTSTAEEDLCIRTVMGKLRCLHRDHYYTTSLNTIVQGSAAECMLISLILIYVELLKNKELDAQLVCNIHDEILIDCPKEHVEAIQNIIESCMESAYLIVFPDGVTRGLIDSKVGTNWKEAK